MVLHRLAEFDPNYRETIQGNDIKGLGVYTDVGHEKIGTVTDVLVDEQGRFRYLIVDLGFWIFGKKVLLPVGRSRIDYDAHRVYALGMTRQQAEDLPKFEEGRTLDYDYEEQVRGVYRDTKYASGAVEASTPTYTRESYTYEHEPSLYNLNQQDHQTLRLYEERLIASKRREKTGEVAIGKHVETQTARVSVPIEKEHIVIERVTPEDAGRVVSPSEANFREGEVARVEIHEETPQVRKEAVLREEVRVKKVVEQETVETQDTVRREELDINAPNLPVEER
ncbi:DUF2382 domain-containing protein [Nodularia spumigena CS-584]|jgi:uncharacterized protein (TIGR02271 family)|uniref:Stress response protein YsnF n=2 Tax=Nodularia spumigena TaxID=70799 RepID=A0A2S0Q7P7_NODSP|nr:DUF2382 domain-containing protein [Nodularia spumigena]AHJ30064.1 hypothetical protein NSP_37610 [Nodularia spumigena CCY9414]AVZ30715.1 stress response protein YsnF [Nodularia spumigena UHCC 0039]EAW43005.1 hypothetical protein N9414_11489 [Nodularia spumigena CCY9414]MDB9384435.1 DUF2382 domain-containing protein [Nodularia spumigena CS-584]MEA5523465.1 DUF2382 domain-containing protein [Nodularia spumigena UHCC 0143]